MGSALPIRLIENLQVHRAEDVLALTAAGEILAADFRIEGIHESGTGVPWGWQLGRLVNVDHHAPVAAMEREVSSAVLALDYAALHGIPDDATVVISHTDCDSVLTAGILSGRLPAERRWGDAAVAADHTGAEDPVADLLQPLDDLRDWALSLASLEALISGEPLDPTVARLVEGRRAQRDYLAAQVAAGRFTNLGPLVWSTFDREVDTELAAPLLPDAQVVLCVHPHARHPGRWIARTRLGRGAPPGLSLQRLGIEEFDPAWGGRWNAGNNKRGGGTAIGPAEYARELQRRLEGWTAGRRGAEGTAV